MWLKLVVLVAVIYPTFGVHEAVVILARGGSKGVRLKNLQTVGGLSLIGRAILTARRAGFNDITVSTDHPLIALETFKFEYQNGCFMIVKANILQRSFITATDWAPSIWGVQEFLNTKPDVQIVILLQATSPLLKANHLVLALKKLHRPIPFDCIFSVTRSYKLRWKYDSLTMSPLNFELKGRPRRQDWSGELIEAGAFYITRRNLIENGYLQNNNCTAWELPNTENLEIDTYYDISLANFVISNKIN